ncbi:MAG: hypothetical protein HQL95_00890 [Magnetococcales bacterium]|nr:hypothetical protein [Magnetococcales bacterium]
MLMPRQKSAKKIRSQTRAARKRTARGRAHPRKNSRPTDQPDSVAKLDAALARLVDASPISQREITDEEEEVFLRQVLDVNAKAVAQHSGVKERDARVVLEALVQAGTLTLRDDLHLVPIKPLQQKEDQGVAEES